MTALRAVEPVVGMEFYEGADPARMTVTAMDVTTIRYRDVGGYSWSIGRAEFRREQEAGLLRPVLWTVGPGEGEMVRLAWSTFNGGTWFWASAVPTMNPTLRRCVALYPTRAAALDAGRAFGWERPVARRVVRQ